MIFAFYPKVAVKLGDERYEFDRSSLMFSEVVAIETASGYSYGEWEQDLRRYSIRAVAVLVHVLRKRAGVPSDFDTLDFAADDLDVVPLHPDGTEFTAQEVADDIGKRLEEAKDPTGAAGNATSGQTPDTGSTPSTSLTLPASTGSSPGSGNGSPGATSKGSKRTRTRT
jgi:hypothetical protein